VVVVLTNLRGAPCPRGADKAIRDEPTSAEQLRIIRRKSAEPAPCALSREFHPHAPARPRISAHVAEGPLHRAEPEPATGRNARGGPS
jgi:hypothetical protein